MGGKKRKYECVDLDAEKLLYTNFQHAANSIATLYSGSIAGTVMQQVVDMLRSTGLRQDEICNMASISVVLLGLNPETRIKPVLEYLKKRGVPEEGIADLVLQHPRIFEYKVDEKTTYLTKGRARIQVDVLPIGPEGARVAAVNYFHGIP